MPVAFVSSSRRGFLIEMFPHLIVVNSLMSIKTWLCRLLSLKVQTLLQLLMLLLLLPLWFLLSFLIVVLLLQLLSTNPVVSQFEHLRRLFFLISSLFSLLASLVASRPGKVRTLLQHSCAIDGAPHCLVLRRHSDPHPDVVFLIEMLPHLISANLVAVQLLLACFRCCCLICTSCLL